MKKIMRNKEQRSSFNGGLSTKIKDTKPRRNYWGNLYEEDTMDESTFANTTEDYDYSDYDVEDDNDSMNILDY
jgi:hypothetical protein